MSTRLLEYAIDTYGEKIAALEKAESSPSVEQILDLLIARDSVHALVRNRTRRFSKNPVIISELDRRLKKQSEIIAQVANLDELRNSFQPSSESWWWYFEASSQRYWWDRFDRYWNILSILLLVVSIYILFDISTKLLSGEPDPVSSLVTTLQTALSTLALSIILTKDGRERVDQTLKRFNVPIHFRQEGKLLLTLILLIALLTFYRALPVISSIYNVYGFDAYREKRLITAQTLYKRALKFNPDNLGTHYNLGLIYEDIDDIENAFKEYKLAAQGNYPGGYNNLGRLYIMTESYSKAVLALSRGLDVVSPNQEEWRYLLLKNLGWARLEQKRYEEAQLHLEEAVNLANKLLLTKTSLNDTASENDRFPIASAYCLAARQFDELAALNDQNQASDTALKLWETCVRYANSDIPEEDIWLEAGRKRIASQIP